MYNIELSSLLLQPATIVLISLVSFTILFSIIGAIGGYKAVRNSAIGLGVIIIIAAITNPSVEEHQDEFKIVMKKEFTKTMMEQASQSESGWELLGTAFGGMLGDKMIDALANVVDRRNFYVFSITTVEWEGEEKYFAIGAFGQIFYSEKFKEAIRSGH